MESQPNSGSYRHPDNLADYGPTPLGAREIKTEYIFDRMTIVSSVASTAICALFEVGWALPNTLQTVANGDTAEIAGMGVLTLMVGGLTVGVHSITRSTRRHMHQLRMNRKFVAVMEREGLTE